MSRKIAYGLMGGLAIATLGFTVPAAAADVPAGTILAADNFDKLKDQTFQGKRIGDMITPSYETWIRKYGLKMKLAPTSDVKLDPAYLKATADNAGKAKLDAQKRVTGYVAGVPFPQLDTSDPECGWKAAWNNYYANTVVGDSWVSAGEVTIFDARSGAIDKFGAATAKFLMEGRTTGQPTLGAPNEHAKYMLVLTAPYDIAGLGVFNAQFNDGKPDDAWVYIRNLRRIRRTSGAGSWMDPQPKMDLLNDDNQGLLGFPGWFKDFKCAGKQTVLAVVTAPDPNLPHTIADRVDTAQAPYWNPINMVWEPREVVVLEATPPDAHPYSKKVLYLDPKLSIFTHGEMYDRKGQFWRLWRQNYAQVVNGNGQPGVALQQTQAIDFQRERATTIDIILSKTNSALDPEWFSEKTLEKAASGALLTELNK